MGDRGEFSHGLSPLPPFSLPLYLFPILRCFFLSYDQAKTLKIQNSLVLVLENHQGQQENALRSDTSG